MRKFIIVFICVLSSILQAQQVLNLEIILNRPVTPKITDWQRDPTILKVIINNPSSINFYISIRIEDETGKNLVYTEKNELRTIFNSDGILDGSRIFDFNTLTIDQSIKQIVTITNLLPEGNYRLCLELLDRAKEAFEPPVEDCEMFNIFIPDPPILLYPQDGENVTGMPQFGWTPVISASPEIQIQYKINIVPIFEGQSGRTTIESNPSLINKLINTTSYQYLPSDQPFTFYPDAVGFAWQVQAMDMSGIPAARNDGKSEIFTFSVTKPDSTNIQKIEAQFSTAIMKLRTRFTNEQKFLKTVDTLESDLKIIFANLSSPNPSYLNSLSGIGFALSKASNSVDSIALQRTHEVQKDISFKKQCAVADYLVGEEIEFTLRIFEKGGNNPAVGNFKIRAKPWPLKDEDVPPNIFNNHNFTATADLKLHAGVYYIWVEPQGDQYEKEKYPSEDFEIPEIPIKCPMDYEVDINLE